MRNVHSGSDLSAACAAEEKSREDTTASALAEFMKGHMTADSAFSGFDGKVRKRTEEDGNAECARRGRQRCLPGVLQLIRLI